MTVRALGIVFAAQARGWAVEITDAGLMSEPELAHALRENDEFTADQDAPSLCRMLLSDALVDKAPVPRLSR